MQSAIGAILGRAAIGGALAAAGWIAYSRYAIPHHLPLPPAVSGRRRTFDGRRAGRLSYHQAGEGSPTLLLHSINAAGSAYEVKPIFERMKMKRRVYALDLPGFGFSDRSPRDYDIGLYVDSIHDMMDSIAAEIGPEPIDVLALSLASEFLARAAVERPGRFRTLALVSPTGFSRGSSAMRSVLGSSREEPETRETPGIHAFATLPLWRRAIYDLLVIEPSIRFFLEKTWGSKNIDEGLLHYSYLTTHQPGAEHAPFAFLSGRLFSKDAQALYNRLSMPVWAPHGVRGDFSDFSEADRIARRPNWRLQAFDTGALIHFERLGEFLSSYERFLAAAERRPIARAASS